MRKPDEIRYLPQYKKGIEKIRKSGNQKAIQSLKSILKCLATGQDLPSRYRNHKLKGVTNQCECHVASDILLVYQYNEKRNLLILKLLDSTDHDSLSRRANLRGSIEFEHIHIY